VWERQLEITLNKRSKKSPYIALRSNQLVGAALLLYVKQDIVHNIRNVESVVKKVGSKLHMVVTYRFTSINPHFCCRLDSWEWQGIKELWLFAWIIAIPVFVLFAHILLQVIIRGGKDHVIQPS
jgi:hypothetical protein